MSKTIEELEAENAELRANAGGEEPKGIWPALYPKYRVIRKGANQGAIVNDAFVLLPKKVARDQEIMMAYAGLCRRDGLFDLADSIESEFGAAIAELVEDESAEV